jgi:hypothetical protein
MKTSARIIAVIGLLLLGFIGLYPPLKRPANLPEGSPKPVPARAFLFTGEYTFYVDLRHQQRVGQPKPEIDFGRLLAEALFIISVIGTGLVVLHKAGANPPSNS